MSNIQRTSILNDTANELNIQQGVEALPKNVQSVALVYPIQQKYSHFAKSDDGSTSGTRNIITTPIDKDFYITGFSMSITKNAACDCTAFSLTSTCRSLAFALGKILMETTTAGNYTMNREFPYPIKLDRNVVIAHTASFTAGTSTRNVCINGFTLE